ncbi:MAG: AAA family ATPase [Stigonema ocellatum SAG 48.90 = DSM 106950]|nr:AAA family ATPase [Stigonema ocellatum SAG 48.90 = DSM 106950]
MRFMNDWPVLADQGTPIVGLEYHATDRASILNQFYRWGAERSMPVYYWNPGYSCLQQVVELEGQSKCILQDTDIVPDKDVPQFLLEKKQAGIYLLEGVLEFDSIGQVSERRSYQLMNAFYQASWATNQQFWVLLESYVELPLNLQALIPVLSNPLPGRKQVRDAVAAFVGRNSSFGGKDDPLAQAHLVRACQGLPLGEIQLVLERSLAFAGTIEELAVEVLNHKVSKLRGRGLEYLNEPDVPNAGGLDLLDETLDRVSALLDPEAEKYGLKFPKGMILWGPPGTGKSLSAKLAAKKMGVPLLAADWGGLRGATAYESERNLRFLLELAQSIAPVILYFDDFDKGFAGWDSDADGGVARRLSGKLLTWMQEHQSQVYMMATVNRLGMLPPELIRRFDDIFFIDLPHEGAMYEIFNLHLSKYFPEFRNSDKSPWSDEQWRILLRDYRLCTPAEIANAVRKAAEEAFYQGKPGKVDLQDLIKVRSLFTPSLIRDEDKILAIRNQAVFARPAAGSDQSRFAIPPAELFE